jgi:hypothetical protein
VGIVLAKCVPGQNTFGKRSGELGEHLRGQGLKRHNILLFMVITILKIIFILSYSNSITQQTSKKAVRKTVIYNKYNKTAVEFEVPRLLIIYFD